MAASEGKTDNAALTKRLERLLRIVVALLILITAIAGGSAAWTTIEARATALERADVVFTERVERIEAEQAQMRDVLVVLQQGQAGMDAKLDILVGDRRNAP